MGKDPFSFLRKRTYVFWVPLAVMGAGLLSALIFPWGEREDPKGGIPLKVLSRIQQERVQARRDHEDFLRTPAGKIWQKYPYWDRELCQKIAAGEVSPGMSKDQVREAVGPPVRVNLREGEGAVTEEWVVEGKERLILKFQNHLLVSVEKR